MGLSYISLVIKSLSKIFVKRAKKVKKNALKKVATQNVSIIRFSTFYVIAQIFLDFSTGTSEFWI